MTSPGPIPVSRRVTNACAINSSKANSDPSCTTEICSRLPLSRAPMTNDPAASPWCACGSRNHTLPGPLTHWLRCNWPGVPAPSVGSQPASDRRSRQQVRCRLCPQCPCDVRIRARQVWESGDDREEARGAKQPTRLRKSAAWLRASDRVADGSVICAPARSPAAWWLACCVRLTSGGRQTGGSTCCCGSRGIVPDEIDDETFERKTADGCDGRLAERNHRRLVRSHAGSLGHRRSRE